MLLSEEIRRINYLFGYKKGMVISEQAAPGGLKGNYDDSKKEYTVAKGDTLGKIGKAFGVPWKEIFEKNKSTLKSKNANLIYVGEKLIIPGKETQDTTDTTGTQNTSFECAKSVSGAKFTKGEDLNYDTVLIGDTLFYSNGVKRKVDEKGEPIGDAEDYDCNDPLIKRTDVPQNIKSKDIQQLPINYPKPNLNIKQTLPQKKKLPRGEEIDKMLGMAPSQVVDDIKKILDENPYTFLTVKRSYDREFPEQEAEYAAKQFALKFTGKDDSYITNKYFKVIQDDKGIYRVYRVDELPESSIPDEEKSNPQLPSTTNNQQQTTPQQQLGKNTTQAAIDAKNTTKQILEKLLQLNETYRSSKNNDVYKELKTTWNNAIVELDGNSNDTLCTPENLKKVEEKKIQAEESLNSLASLVLRKDEKDEITKMIQIAKEYPNYCKTT